MPRYKQHIIAFGDTPQIIAEREMGDVSLWFDLVKANNLHYPYIVNTVDDKLKDSNHLVTIGDKIIIPLDRTLADIDTAKLSKYDKKVLQDIVLGNDLQITKYNKTINAHGSEDEIVELTGNGKGDVKLAKGFENIKQMLIMRLLTPKGSLPLHPDYGSNIQYIMGEHNNLANADILNNTIQEELEADNRIKLATLVNYSVNKTYYTSEWKIQLYSFEKYFSLLVQRDKDNNFIIL